MAIAILASSCSLLFNETTGDGNEACGDVLDQTLSFYPVADDSIELLDARGLSNGQPYLGKDISSTGITSILGPCDTALSFAVSNNTDRWFIEIDSSEHRVVPLSVDFWLLFTPAIVQGDEAAILTRDQRDYNSGDLLITQLQDGDQSRILVRTQSANQERYTCSGLLDRETWHHVAVSIDDGMAVKLFVDGAAVEQVGDTLLVGNASVLCENGSFGVGANMIQNEWPWIIGASNSGSTSSVPQIGDFLIGGAIDNLRIRQAAFTEEEAAAIFSP